MSARVAILGAGPAGLVAGCILAAAGRAPIIYESASRERMLERSRAGLYETRTVTALTRLGLAKGLLANAMEHASAEFRNPGERPRILDLAAEANSAPQRVWPQHELVADLLDTYIERRGEIHFSTPATNVNVDTGAVIFADGRTRIFATVLGADGARGASREAALRAGAYLLTRDHSVRWLAILAAAPPSAVHTIYARHPRGFAGHMLRSAEMTRYYLQVSKGNEDWPTSKIWPELTTRLGINLVKGPIVERNIFDLTSAVVNPTSVGKLVLLGDAAHTVPPMGAKGANLAIGDAVAVAEALLTGDPAELTDAVAMRAKACWDAQLFSERLIAMTHADTDPYARRTGQAALEGVLHDEHARTAFAHAYLGTEAPAISGDMLVESLQQMQNMRDTKIDDRSGRWLLNVASAPELREMVEGVNLLDLRAQMASVVGNPRREAVIISQTRARLGVDLGDPRVAAHR